MRFFWLAALLMALTIQSAAALDELRVQVLRSGAVVIAGKSTNLAGLRKMLNDHAARKDAAVLYYREGADRDPTPAQFEAFKVIMEAQLPISMSTKPDFSDYVDEKGQSRPRKP